MTPLATLKHLGSKNADYGAAEQYLLFEHDEFTMKPVLDENGRLIPREDYRLSTLNCGGEDFAVACMRSNLRYEKNQRREDVKSHHYIISFDPRDGPDNGLTVDRTAVHLLENREYTGCLVNFKTEKPSYKVKHSVENPIEKQAIFPNHHEPIIDTETWERVQELRKQRKRPNRYDEVGLFSGMLFCADCGHVLYQQRYQNKNRKQDCYICGSYKKRTRDCTAHFIRTDLLTAGVLSNLRQVTEYAARHESRFVKLLIQQNEIGGKRKTAAATKQLEQAQTRIAEVNRIIKRLYEDNVSGKISDERFMELSADYEQEQRELKDRAAALQEELSKSQAATVNAEKFMGIVRKHLAFEELTPTLLREMIEKIVVHECSYDENGTRRQDIEIYYSFVGKIDLPEA